MATVDASADLVAPDVACPALETYDAVAQKCVTAPILDIIACPLYAPNCTLQFVRVAPGDHTKQSVSLRNTGAAPLHVQSVALSGGGPFTVAPVLPATLASQEILGIDVTFQPTQDGFYTGTLTVQSDAVVTTPDSVPLRAATIAKTSCSNSDACLVGESCQNGSCVTCPMVTPPQCNGGTIVLSGAPGTCQQPMCQCTPPKVYNAGLGGCIAPI
jgi:hypothetical protein